MASPLTPVSVADGTLSTSAGSRGTLTQLVVGSLLQWSDAMLMSDAMFIDDGVLATGTGSLSSSAVTKGSLAAHTHTAGTLV